MIKFVVSDEKIKSNLLVKNFEVIYFKKTFLKGLCLMFVNLSKKINLLKSIKFKILFQRFLKK